MSQREPDDTTKPDGPPREREREPGSYYYDDATGYEVYDPSAEIDEEEEGDRAPRGSSRFC